MSATPATPDAVTPDAITPTSLAAVAGIAVDPETTADIVGTFIVILGAFGSHYAHGITADKMVGADGGILEFQATDGTLIARFAPGQWHYAYQIGKLDPSMVETDKVNAAMVRGGQ